MQVKKTIRQVFTVPTVNLFPPQEPVRVLSLERTFGGVSLSFSQAGISLRKALSDAESTFTERK